MQIKGIAVKTLRDFIRTNFNSRFQEWLNALPVASRKIMSSEISAGSWYPLDEALIQTQKKMSELFYGGKNKGYWEYGRFAAEQHLAGIYKMFVKIGSPTFIISLSSVVFSAYFKLAEMKTITNIPQKAVIHIVKFPEPGELIETTIGGWMEYALELSGAKEPKIEITRSLTRGDEVTEYSLQWK